MWLVFLHGPPGAGKLTVARELETQTGFRLAGLQSRQPELAFVSQLAPIFQGGERRSDGTLDSHQGWPSGSATTSEEAGVARMAPGSCSRMVDPAP